MDLETKEINFIMDTDVKKTNTINNDAKKKQYKHMSCVLGEAVGEVAQVVELMQQALGLADSQFLRGIVHKFLIDNGYAQPLDPKDKKKVMKTGGLILGDVSIDMKKLQKLKDRVAEKTAI